MAQRVILDTDIGDDIDDAYALALIVASPELELLGVTTVLMNTVARARQARTLLAVAGRPEVPVAVGCGGSLSPRTTYDFDARQAYLEGRLPNQDATCLPEALLPPADPRHAIDYLVETLLAGDGDIIVLTIGAMTNLAMAMLKEPRILARIPRIVAMAGTFDRHMDEWNIRCDPVAAQIVLQSGVPVDLVPLDVTMQVRYEREQLLRLRDAHHPLAQRLWAAHAARATSMGIADPLACEDIMHDPLAVESLLDDSLLQWRRGRASVELCGGTTYGYTTFEQDDRGLHRYAWAVNAPAALELWMSRVLAYESR